MKKKSKGFTLIELLAVIVILGIILTIVVTNVVKYIGEAKKGAFKDEAKKIANQVTNQLALKELGQTDKVTCDTTSDCKEIYDINDNNYEMKVLEASGSYYLHLIGKGSYSGVKLTTSDSSSNQSCNNNSIMIVIKSSDAYTGHDQIEKAVKNAAIDTILDEIKSKINSGFNKFYSTGQTMGEVLGDGYKYMGDDLKVYFLGNTFKDSKKKCEKKTLVRLSVNYNIVNNYNYRGFESYFNNNNYCVTNQNISFCMEDSTNGKKVFSKPKCN